MNTVKALKNAKLRLAAAVLAVLAVLAAVSAVAVLSANADAGGRRVGYVAASPLADRLMEKTRYYVLVRAKQLGASHYAYTEALAEDMGGDSNAPEGTEAAFRPGSQLVLLTLVPDEKTGTVDRYEEVLLDSPDGVIRDPDVSADGERVLFSWKKSAEDDFHLYELTLGDRETVQLTRGSGVSDTEPKYLSDGSIIFSSSRCVQSVDCWKTPVSNMYKCSADGSSILRLGVDQVHTTYPTVTSDGRIIYTRWDYNDRTQMYVQAVFQMFEDGTNQTEVFGNDSNFPTTLLHTREVPGSSGLYISVASGHHVYQQGKLCLVDTRLGRNDGDAVSFIFDPDYPKSEDYDTYGQEGRVYKYPYAFDETLILYTAASAYTGSSTPYNIYAADLSTGESLMLAEGSEDLPASQLVPVLGRELFSRPSMVNYASETGVYYVADVYQGEGMEGAERGSVEYLRVVALEFRNSSIGATVASGSGSSDPFSPISTGNGAWDVKTVLGVVPVYPDGSAMFRVPANTALYFQLLDKDGCAVQTMRSWSTLMPNEIYSCVGCHEDKNTAPSSSSAVTDAMRAGVSELAADLWMDDAEYTYKDAKGFSYLERIQPILDAKCVSCHSDTDAAMSETRVKAMSRADLKKDDYVLPYRSEWLCSLSDTPVFADGQPAGIMKTARAPFGIAADAPSDPDKSVNTLWDGETLFMRAALDVYQYDLNQCALSVTGVAYGNVTLHVNETELDTFVADGDFTIPLTAEIRTLLNGENDVIDVRYTPGDRVYIDVAVTSGVTDSAVNNVTLVEKGSKWKYVQARSLDKAEEGWNTLDFDDSAWKSGRTPIGDRENYKTPWNSDTDVALFARQTFNVENAADYKNAALSMNVFYDDTIELYINGRLIYSAGDWVDAYTDFELAADASKYLVEGENVVAVSLLNTAGGRQWDCELTAAVRVSTESEPLPIDEGADAAQISLEGIDITGTRQKKYFPLSYLVLTGSKPNSTNWVGDHTNDYISWISSMSRPELYPPYSYGAAVSPLVERLRGGHGGLTDTELRAVECWIDLGVPAYGAYDENVSWSDNDRREFEEKTAKRAFYEMMNDISAAERMGKYADAAKNLTITYNDTSVSGARSAVLYTGGKYKPGDRVMVELPQGERWLAVSLSSKAGEALVYCPDGAWTFDFPDKNADIAAAYPKTMVYASDIAYTDNVITARLPSEEEVNAYRNLALNPYAGEMSGNNSVYPTALSDSEYNNQREFAAVCAIDGHTGNASHGVYPSQSWGPDDSDGHYITVVLGRDAEVDTLSLLIRTDFPHDTHFTSVTVVAVNAAGETTLEKTVDLYRTDEAQLIDLGGVTASSVKLYDFTRAEEKWAAVTELELWGRELAE